MDDLVSLCFFFFQAEDGIRDLIVTGVQTCALPIWAREAGAHRGWPERGARGVIATGPARPARTVGGRSEVRVASLQDALPHAFRWKMRTALSPRIAACAAAESPASRTMRAGSGSPSQNGWSLPSRTRSAPTSATRYASAGGNCTSVS